MSPRAGRRRAGARGTRGFTYIEVLAAALLVAMAAAGAIASWSISSRAAANKRVTEMGVYLAVREIERLKGVGYAFLPDGVQGTTYYDRNGGPVANAVARGYTVQSWVTTVVNRNGPFDTRIVRELKAQVTPSAGGAPYDTEQTMLTYGGE